MKHRAAGRIRSAFPLAILPIAVVVLVWLARRNSVERPPGPTFSSDVAPIIHARCAGCHRPGGSGPFDLLTWEDVRDRAQQVSYVVGTGYMPPWPPGSDHGKFQDSRALRLAEIAIIDGWVEAGCPEGEDPVILPDPPGEWDLGTPDLVVSMSEPYPLGAAGKDVYRKFVIPIPFDGVRHVKAVEFKASAPRAVHHATLYIDYTGSWARECDDLDEEVGFEQEFVSDAFASPPGYFIGHLPGKRVLPEPEGMAWALDGRTDIVLELHMSRTGKPEDVGMTLGFHFAEEPPTVFPVLFRLGSQAISIPAGARDHVVEDRYILPVAVRALSIWPHAHYLGKVIESYALLPDGSKESLIRIRSWNFDWQDQYRYAEPVLLPAGSTLVSRFVYDNSRENVRNPHDPPRRIRFGPNSADEMANVYLQVLPVDPADREELGKDILDHEARIEARGERMLLAEATEPRLIAKARYNLGGYLARRGSFDQAREHLQALLAMTEGVPDGWRARAKYNLGWIAQRQGRIEGAETRYREAIQLLPDLAEAHSGLGMILSSRHRHDEAESSLRRAVDCDPEEAGYHRNLGVVLERMGRHQEAAAEFLEELSLDPSRHLAHNRLGNLFLRAGDVDLAKDHYRRALSLEPGFGRAHNNLGIVFALQGELDRARAEFEAAIDSDPGDLDAILNLGRLCNQEGRFAQARRHFRKVLQLDPLNRKARLGLRLVRAGMETAGEGP